MTLFLVHIILWFFTFFIKWGDVLHMLKHARQLRIILKVFFRQAQQLSDINLLASICIKHFEERFSGDCVIFNWIVLLSLVISHLCTQFRSNGRLGILRFSQAKELLHLIKIIIYTKTTRIKCVHDANCNRPHTAFLLVC